MANYTGTLTNNVANTTYVATVGDDYKLTVVLTCNNGYAFDGDIAGAGYDYNGDYIRSRKISYNDDRTVCTLIANGDFSDSSCTFTLTGKTKRSSTANVGVNANLTNCTGTGYTEYVSNGAVLDITLTANDNCLFDTSTPVIVYDDENGDAVQTQFTVSDDKKTATLKFTVPTADKIGSKAITIYATANVQQAVTGGYGLINVYVTNDNELNEFAKTRFYKTSSDDGTGATVTPIDLGVYVNRLQRLYFNVPVKTTDVIKCGNYNTGISTHAPVNNKITHDFGTVEIPTVNNNTVDYQTVVQAFLPFVGFVNVPNDYVGKTVQLTFDVDIITGTGVYKLTCDNVVFAVYDCKPCTDVIYRTGDYDLRTIGGDDFNNDVDKGITPHIYIKEYKSTGVTRNNDNRRVQIGTMTGYNTFDDVTTIATDDMLQAEQTQIYDKLRTGVYIETSE